MARGKWLLALRALRKARVRRASLSVHTQPSRVHMNDNKRNRSHTQHNRGPAQPASWQWRAASSRWRCARCYDTPIQTVTPPPSLSLLYVCCVVCDLSALFTPDHLLVFTGDLYPTTRTCTCAWCASYSHPIISCSQAIAHDDARVHVCAVRFIFSSVIKCLWEVFFGGFGLLFLSCVCVGVGGGVLCRCVCVRDLLIFLQAIAPDDARVHVCAVRFLHATQGNTELPIHTRPFRVYRRLHPTISCSCLWFCSCRVVVCLTC